MARVRHEYLQNNLSLPDSGEFVFSFGSRDVLTCLGLKFEATNGATSNKANTIYDVLESVEILDGSRVIVSVTGKELGGITTIRNNYFNRGSFSEFANAVQNVYFDIYFGRWYADEDIALDLSKFSNPQVRVKWNLAKLRATGATGFVSNSAKLTVLATYLEGNTLPVGYLSLKRHFSFTTASSGEVVVELPTDEILRAVYLRSFEDGVGGLSGISNVKNFFDDGKYKYFDLAIEDFLRLYVTNYNRFSYRHNFVGVDEGTLYALLKYDENVFVSTALQDVLAQYASTGIGQGTLQLETASTGAAIATDTNIYGHVSGYLPLSVAGYFYGDYTNPDFWINAGQYKTNKLVLTQNNAGADCSIVVEQFVQYQS